MKKGLILLLAVAMLTQTACTQKNDDKKNRARPTTEDKVIPGGKDKPDPKAPASGDAAEGTGTPAAGTPAADQAKKDTPTPGSTSTTTNTPPGATTDKGGGTSVANKAAAEAKEKAEAEAAAALLAKKNAEGTSTGSGATSPAAGTTAATPTAPAQDISGNGQNANDAKGELVLPDVKVLMASTLHHVKKGGLVVVADNALLTEETGLKTVTQLGIGLSCQTQLSAGLKDGDVLKYVKTFPGKTDAAKVRDMVFQFKSDDKKELQLVCKVVGEITKLNVIENFEMILEFRNADGKFETYASEDPKLVDLKTRSFKILDLEAFMKTDKLTRGEDQVQVIVDGRVVDFEVGNFLVVQRKTRASCLIVERTGNLSKDVVYKDGEASRGEIDATGIVVMTYRYKASDNPANGITINCSLNPKAPSFFRFDTFKGILEFGADKDAKVETFN